MQAIRTNTTQGPLLLSTLEEHMAAEVESIKATLAGDGVNLMAFLIRAGC